MGKRISLALICALAILCATMALAEEEALFIYQPQGSFVELLQDGRLQVGSLFLVQNNDDIPLYFDSFDVPLLDGEGNALTTAFMDSCSPRFIMPGHLSYVWCTTKPVTIVREQLSDIGAPQTECFGFPDLTDTSKDLSVSDEKCGVITLDGGEPTLRISATVTNAGSRECSGSGGFFLIEGNGDDAPSFPVAFKADAFLGKLAPGESVEVGVELTELQIYIMQSLLGYQSFDPETFRFATHAYASKLK